MQPFHVHTGLAVALDRANVDTDQIIPKQFLKRVERTGFGQFLFFDWRFNAEGSQKPDFVLNDARYRGASILIAGKNFGCGSSREHAPWALADYGFRAIIAPSFADIFASNSAKNGLLLCAAPDDVVAELTKRCTEATHEITVDLERCEIRDAAGMRALFQIDPFRRECLLNGWDDIGLSMRYEADISRYEQSHVTQRTFDCA
ncbi:MAG: 3-isopropylmalate dehydratase small subunit [Terriglobales bacterium]